MWLRIAEILVSWFVSSVVVGILVGKSISRRPRYIGEDNEPDSQSLLSLADFTATNPGSAPASAQSPLTKAVTPDSKPEQIPS